MSVAEPGVNRFEVLKPDINERLINQVERTATSFEREREPPKLCGGDRQNSTQVKTRAGTSTC